MIFSRVFQFFNQARIHSKMVKNMFIDDYLNRNLFFNEKYLSNQSILNNYEFSVYSQNGEDGIISEIFKRIGVTNTKFVEIGVQDGNECNTGLLLVNNWTGLWVEANKRDVQKIRQQFNYLLEPGLLQVSQNFVKSDNINSILNENNVPVDFDLLSIDIDGNDYWVWNAIERYTPRVVVVEYNILFTRDAATTMAYAADHVWDKTSYHGASLAAFQKLGTRKGYTLVHTDSWAPNALFVLNTALPTDYKPKSLEELAVWDELVAPPDTGDRPWVNV